ncbi:hypothetical protein HZY97_02895 [Sphingomonas sp. R-74633]|uniref:hypothetical protein n=1 Tax=Sphingomonas sp. R-74633 TaxID=2751188 RepID=UPI0015D23797|nr:hypothetical protein [Sphingomonas sp. R-74633]NYT39692.1 hypothetical protein [Sphingomonas sp. R-74633]
MSADSNAAPFAMRTVLVMVVLGTVGFLAFLLLAAYGEDLQPAQRPGNHALSTSAVGFAGAAELVRQVHGKVGFIRRDGDFDNVNQLIVLTPAADTDPKLLEKILERRSDYPTIVVLPKWITFPRRDKPAWVQSIGTLDPARIVKLVAPLGAMTLTDNPKGLRTISGETLEPLIDDDQGRMLAAQVKDRLTIVVADPDLLDNQGLATLAGAERAMDVLDRYAVADDIAFDLTLHGYGLNPNLLKLAFEAPFLPLTLCLIIAALLAGWHAMLRFGPALPEGRGVAFGKRAIAENGAALLRLAGRRHRTGDRYAALIRDAAASATGAPASLPPEALDRYLDRLDKGGEPFTEMAGRAEHAQDTRALLDAARALYQWKRTVTREH